MTGIKKLALSLVCGAWPLAVSAQIVMDLHPYISTPAEQKEATAMSLAMGGTPGWNPAALRQMLAGANWASDRLHLATPHPIRASDIVYKFIGPPGVSLAVNPWGDNFDNPDIPRETRLRALRFGASGIIDTTNFHFGFAGGRLFNILRLDAPMTERYSLRLDQLVGKPSLINDAQAHELALKWLTALDVDVTGLKWTVNQARYRPRGATNVVLLPIYHVRFGNIHYPRSGNIPASDEPQVHVEILGTTKELQEIRIDPHVLYHLYHAPVRFIPNAMALTPTNPPLKQLAKPPSTQTNSPSP
jgi:hypothetical protein